MNCGDLRSVKTGRVLRRATLAELAKSIQSGIWRDPTSGELVRVDSPDPHARAKAETMAGHWRRNARS